MNPNNPDNKKPRVLSRFLDTNGDGTGTKIATGDYSGASTDFYIKPDNDSIYIINEIVIYLSDIAPIVAEGYGGDVALTNGLVIKEQRGSTVLTDLTDGIPIKTNGQFIRITYEVQLASFDGESQALVAKIKPSIPFRLIGGRDERIVITLNDNFSSLLDHTFMANGYIETILE